MCSTKFINQLCTYIFYQGVLPSGKIIAVKKLFEMHLVDEEQFHKEVTNLVGIKHENIVRLVGYCAESRWEAIKLPNGNNVMAQIPTWLLCFEYLPNNSLQKYVSGMIKLHNLLVFTFD